ncbi:hypothetical protein [Anaerococcus sp. mt242]|uniref:hypothetical protein n=1 Tax=unclassified Anaerococcus TaxID=2614126 RepID=UPI001934213A|nr:hypothetical protein [Anaerococcus sp. mt242]MBM0045946.1 hypothetical protein [Anaerococcus sp. mt242]
MKKGFVSILTLFVLLVLSLTITFVYRQNENTNEYIRDLYSKKQSIYLAESVMNRFLVENYDELKDIILDDNSKLDKKNTDNYELDKSRNVYYENQRYYIRIWHYNNNDESKLQNVYKVTVDNVRVGSSKANSEAWFKLVENNDDLEKDSKSIKMIIRRTY